MENNQELLNFQEKLMNEFAEGFNNNPTTILVNEKLEKFQDLLQQKIVENCSQQQKEYERFGKADLVNNELKFTKFQGKERDFDAAFDKYLKCINPFVAYMIPIQSYLGSSAGLMSKSYENCFQNCARTSNKLEDAKTCVRTCVEKNYVNNFKANQSVISELVDNLIGELQKSKGI
jgi:hypothetical protein